MNLSKKRGLNLSTAQKINSRGGRGETLYNEDQNKLRLQLSIDSDAGETFMLLLHDQ